MKNALFAAGLAVIFVGIVIVGNPLPRVAAEDGALEPVQVLDTYETMDYLFEPAYEALKAAVATEPEGRQQWRAIYTNSFAIAEMSNLLFSRSDADYMSEEDWPKMAAQSREAAKALGEAVREQDYALITKRFNALRESCNACHTRFDPENAPEIE